MRFIVDMQLPPKLAYYIQAIGHNTTHTKFYKNGHQLKDREIIRIAKEENRVIITKDSDFLDNYITKGAPP